MLYYKISINDDLIGVISDNDLRKYQKKHDLLLMATVDEAQLAQYGGKYYRAIWMKPFGADELPTSYPFDWADIYQIDKEDYDAIKQIEEESSEIPGNFFSEPAPAPQPEPIDISMELAKAQELKIKNLTADCARRIINGVSIDLESGETFRTMLTITDQLNIQRTLLLLSHDALDAPVQMLNHATSQFTQVSQTDISNLAVAIDAHILEKRMRLSKLKQKVNACTTAAQVADITWHSEID